MHMHHWGYQHCALMSMEPKELPVHLQANANGTLKMPPQPRTREIRLSHLRNAFRETTNDSLCRNKLIYSEEAHRVLKEIRHLAATTRQPRFSPYFRPKKPVQLGNVKLSFWVKYEYSVSVNQIVRVIKIMSWTFSFNICICLWMKYLLQKFFL